MSVRSLQEVVPRQVTTTLLMAVVEFAVGACVLVWGINRLWMIPTSISGTYFEWMVWWVNGTLSGVILLSSLIDIDRELGVSD